MKNYKFKIHYTLKKENDRANALSQRCDYMKTKRIFNKNILRINNDKTLLLNYEKIITIMRIVKDDKEQFSMKKNYKYRKIKSTNTSKSITIVYYKNIQR